MDHSSAYFLVSSARQWLARLAGRNAHRLTSSFLPLVSGLSDGSSDGSVIGLVPRSFHSSVACPARLTERSSAYFLVFLLVSGLPGSLDGTLIGLLPRFFRSSVACPARRTERSSAYFLVPSARQWLARLAGWNAHRLTSSFLPLVSGLSDSSSDGSLMGLLPRSFRSSVACPARRTERSSAYFLAPSARQCLARLAGWIAHRLTSSFLPLASGLPDGSPDGSHFGFLPRYFRSSVSCPTAPRTDHSSAYFLVPSTRQWLARQLLGRITHGLTSSFLALVSGLPAGSPD